MILPKKKKKKNLFLLFQFYEILLGEKKHETFGPGEQEENVSGHFKFKLFFFFSSIFAMVKSLQF